MKDVTHTLREAGQYVFQCWCFLLQMFFSGGGYGNLLKFHTIGISARGGSTVFSWCSHVVQKWLTYKILWKSALCTVRRSYWSRPWMMLMTFAISPKKCHVIVDINAPGKNYWLRRKPFSETHIFWLFFPFFSLFYATIKPTDQQKNWSWHTFSTWIFNP